LSKVVPAVRLPVGFNLELARLTMIATLAPVKFDMEHTRGCALRGEE
jgi:hypothetical protein